MISMAFLFAVLFAVVILLPVAAVWMANRLGVFAESVKKSQILQFSDWATHAHHRHIDAA
jgi:hypothetical protein